MCKPRRRIDGKIGDKVVAIEPKHGTEYRRS
jgi:hypothetical protein